MAEQLSGMIFDIRRFSVHDGPGIRTTVFFKGCPLSCWWCHNPESQQPTPEVMLRETRCIACGSCLPVCPQHAISREGNTIVTDLERCQRCATCVPVCPAEARELVGREISLPELMSTLRRDIPFYDESGGGVTFSGGEPLMQPRFLLEALRACKQLELHTALDTSGFARPELMEQVRPLVDLFLYDLKLIDDTQHRRYTGVSNQTILANLRQLSSAGAAVIIRVPLIPGITDTPQNLEAITALAAELPGVRRIDLLPYHRAALTKYNRLNLTYALDDLQPPDETRVQALAQRLGTAGVPIHIGG